MKRTIRFFSDSILLIVSVVSIIPFIYMLLMSFKSTLNAYDLGFSADTFTLQHYAHIFSQSNFLRYFSNSVIVAVGGVMLTLTCCCLAGYAFSKLKFRGNNQLFLLLILTMVIPSEVIIIPLYLIVRGAGWLNTFKALILPLPGAFGVFIMRQAMLGIPNELLESAKIDGATDFKILCKVVLPLVKSSLLTLSIFTFMGAWNNFLWPLIVSSKDEMRTLPLALSSIKTLYDTDIGLTMACATISFLPPFIFYLVMQSRFEAGITLSGLKG